MNIRTTIQGISPEVLLLCQKGGKAFEKAENCKGESAPEFPGLDNYLELRKAGTVYEAPEERAKYLQARRIVKILKEPDPKAAAPPAEKKAEDKE